MREENENCIGNESVITVRTKRLPTFIQDSNYTFCSENRIINLEPSQDSIVWFDASKNIINAPSIDLNNVQTYNYTYVVEVENCRSQESNVTVDVQQAAPTTSNNTFIYCERNETVVLSPNSADFQWLNSDTIELAITPTIDLSTSGSFNFFVLGKLGQCLSDTSRIDVTINSKANTPASVSTTACQDDITFPIGFPNNIQWIDNMGNNLPNEPEIDLSSPGTITYGFYASNSNNCNGDTNTYTVNILPAPEKLENQVINQCQGDTPITLSPVGTGFTWYSDTTQTGAASYTTDPNKNGSLEVFYTSTGSNQCESSFAKVQININGKSTNPGIISPQNFCFGGNGKLIPENSNIIWYSDTTNKVFSTTSPTANTQMAGDFKFFAANIASGCPSDIQTIIGRVSPKPPVPNFNDQVLCMGEAVYRPPYNNNDITWIQGDVNNTGQNTPYTTNTSVADSIVYFYYRTLSSCNSDTVSYYVKINPTPPTASPLAQTICENDSLMLISYAAPIIVTYTFSNGDVFNPLQDSNIAAKEDYSFYNITLLNENTGCTSNVNENITVNTVTSLQIPDQNICIGEAIDFRTFTQSYESVTWKMPNTTVLNEAFNTSILSQQDSGKHHYTLIQNGCAYSDSVNLNTLNKPSIEFADLARICPDESTVVTILNSTGNGAINVEYLYNNDNLKTKGSTDLPFFTLNYGDKFEVVSISDDFCTSTLNINLDANNHTHPRVDVNPTSIEFCKDSVMTMLSYTGEGPFSSKYQFEAKQGFYNSSTDTIVFFEQIGSYNIIEVSDANCTVDTVINIIVTSPLSSEPTFEFSDSLLCTPSVITFEIKDLDPAANYSYSINQGVFNPYSGIANINAESIGCSSLQVRVIKDQCEVFYNINNAYCLRAPISVDIDLAADIFDNTTNLVLNNRSRNYDSLQWYSDFESFEMRENVIFDFPLDQDNIEVCLEAYNIENCFADTCIYFKRPVETKVYVPSAFSPNDDDINEVFKSIIDDNLEEYSLEIFNRWGEKIFESADLSRGWDGFYKGVMSPYGVYTWRLRYFSFKDFNVEYYGVVNLIR